MSDMESKDEDAQVCSFFKRVKIGFRCVAVLCCLNAPMFEVGHARHMDMVQWLIPGLDYHKQLAVCVLMNFGMIEVVTESLYLLWRATISHNVHNMSQCTRMRIPQR